MMSGSWEQLQKPDSLMANKNVILMLTKVNLTSKNVPPISPKKKSKCQTSIEEAFCTNSRSLHLLP